MKKLLAAILLLTIVSCSDGPVVERTDKGSIQIFYPKEGYICFWRKHGYGGGLSCLERR